MSGKFEGIGAEIGMRDNLLTIISPSKTPGPDDSFTTAPISIPCSSNVQVLAAGSFNWKLVPPVGHAASDPWGYSALHQSE